jgi:hypothetical protein
MEGNHKLLLWDIQSLTCIQLLCMTLEDCLAFPKDKSKLLYVLQLYILLGHHKERSGMDLYIPCSHMLCRRDSHYLLNIHIGNTVHEDYLPNSVGNDKLLYVM